MADDAAELTIRPNGDAELSESQLQELATSLLDKRRELWDRITAYERQIVAKDDCAHVDAADAASAQENRLRARGMVEQYQRTIQEIDAALSRLEDGTYGVSEATGEPIPYQRLRLIPWARMEGGGGNSDG